MARVLPPLWLREPSRFSGISHRQGIWTLTALALLLIASLTAFSTPAGHQPGAPVVAEQTDLYLYGSIVDGIRAGGKYYSVTASALRAGNFPLKPFLTFRLPTLAMVQAMLPPWGVTALLELLALAAAIAWYRRLRPLLSGVLPLTVAMLLMLAGMLACIQPALAPFHEIWSALLIALSLALRKPDRWIDAVALGLCAMLIRETAALYILVMAILAFAGGHRREAIGWAVALGIFFVALTLHAMAVDKVVGPLDPASPGWHGLHGFGLFVKSVVLATALQGAPLWIAAPLIALALFGWASCPGAAGLRVLATLLSYALFISVMGRTDTFYWGLMVAPLLLVGLIFVPDGLRDAVRAMLDTRRVRVQRISR
ncbi:hypothetical protein GCM10023219_06210 [Stakelama sediminis]|uniref:DUF2029 domain-containing protein n=1 Tax=Stakelama sediminis TaxID=463200 RepID=A0A840YUW4_9SPHN|nr:hypothetical protein [Stakelama sediminis]MBB5717339.1 hypothetical protein [Stakelama sediminis]